MRWSSGSPVVENVHCVGAGDVVLCVTLPVVEVFVVHSLSNGCPAGPSTR